jgi:hypothetical protein
MLLLIIFVRYNYCFDYIGHADDENARKVLDSVKIRREYEELLKGIKNDPKEVRKALRGRNSISPTGSVRTPAHRQSTAQKPR